jgi:tetratricopeptide (TPR) repeat protein
MSGVDVYSLPLSTKEGFVLSRVDGVSSVEDISIMVGVKQEELLQILDRLADLRAVKLPWAPARAAKPADAKPPTDGKKPERADPSSVHKREGAPEKPERKTGVPDSDAAVARVLAEPAQPLYLESELDIEAAIDIATKKRILNAYYGLDGKDYYQTLGVARDADRKLVKSAYFELSKLFHPDSLFGRELGPFKTKMEVVFKRLTEAYEVLGRNARRKEYDEYLASTATTHAIVEQLEHSVVSLEPEPSQLVAAEVVEPSRPASVPPPTAAAAAVSAEPKKPIDLRPPQTAEQRRAALRERLRRNLTGPATVVATVPPPPTALNPSERRDSAIKGLRQGLRASATSANRVDPVVAHLKKAHDAERAGDLLTAASALQSALALDPNRLEIQEQYARVSAAVTRSLADNYEKQARYEEKMGKWAAAASSWERVAEGRPDNALAARSAAEALLKAGGDLHRAQRHAQRAVDTAPSDVANVVVLARVLLAAGLRLNARRELEKAVNLDPQNEMIRNLLREAR